jgi:hypothetical protein
MNNDEMIVGSEEVRLVFSLSLFFVIGVDDFVCLTFRL